jgi:uncharacterized protein (DUF2236 family)
MAATDGYFAPESVIRRVGNSPLVPLLGGGPAVLLQVAHPLVAAGVTAYSDYQSDLWRRLLRTLRALYLITYGSKAEADAAASAVQSVHACVRGTTHSRLGPYPAGTEYSAADPELMLWVHGTLVETSLAVYHRFVYRLRRDEQDAYYRDMALMARLFGTPSDVIPPTLGDFRDYLRGEFSSPRICVTEPARDVAAVILEAPLPAPLRLIAPAHRLSTAVLLPPRLRREYGLRSDAGRAIALKAAALSIRFAAVPLFVAAARVSPPAYSL